MTRAFLKPALACAITLSLFGLSACRSVPKPIEGRVDPHGNRQIMFESSRLQNRTSVGTPKVARDDTGLLFVTVPITNTTRSPIDVEYRATFYDRPPQEGGVPVAPKTTWFRKRLTSRVTDTISINSTSPRAGDFQLDIRQAR